MKYLLIWGIAMLFTITGMMVLLKRDINLIDLQKLTTKTAGWSVQDADACQYFIVGDPSIDSKKYVKIRLSCKNGKVSMNTMALAAIEQHTFEGVVNELGRINGFNAADILGGGSWECRIDGNLVTKKDFMIKELMTLECNE